VDNLFAHTISRIDFLDGMIRVELAIASPANTPAAKDAAAGQETNFQGVYALHMPLGGFMRGAVVQEAFIREMVSRGILPAPGTAGTQPAPAAKAKAEGSPNFR
jgi:hypothetical protein